MVYEIYVDNIDRDEMRSGFLVTSERKKLWNTQINMFVEFERICKKHNLKWYAHGGTLLGAVRHGGFIPWDDDFDIAMMRPEYEKFKRIVASELDPEFVLDVWYNYVREGEPNPNNYYSIKHEHLQKYPWLPFSPFLKFRDPKTLFLKYSEIEDWMQSIWIDIFPLDPVPPFDTPEQERIYRIGDELRRAATYDDQIRHALETDQPFVDRERVAAVIDLPFHERALAYENYMAENFFESKHVCFINFRTRPTGAVTVYRSLSTSAYHDMVELPFEKIKLQAPIDYEQGLAENYGDNWRVPIYMPTHSQLYSSEVSSKDYFALRFKNMKSGALYDDL